MKALTLGLYAVSALALMPPRDTANLQSRALAPQLARRLAAHHLDAIAAKDPSFDATGPS